MSELREVLGKLICKSAMKKVAILSDRSEGSFFEEYKENWMIEADKWIEEIQITHRLIPVEEYERLLSQRDVQYKMMEDIAKDCGHE